MTDYSKTLLYTILINNLVDSLGNRHINIELLGQFIGCLGGRNSFDNHAHISFNISQFFATTQRIAGPPVARVDRSSCDNQVADTRKTAVSQRAGSKFDTKSGNFSQPACDDGCFCIVPLAPSAEETIVRDITLITAASKDLETAKYVQELFSNHYFRLYT